MTERVQPLLHKQQYPFPPFQPLSEEKLQEKGLLHLYCFVACTYSCAFCSPEMAASQSQAVFREKEVWFCGGTKGRHAA